MQRHQDKMCGWRVMLLNDHIQYLAVRVAAAALVLQEISFALNVAPYRCRACRNIRPEGHARTQGARTGGGEGWRSGAIQQ